MTQLVLMVLLAGDPSVLTAEAKEQYRDAVAKTQAGQHREAATILNQLAAEFPKVAEVFAARCSAQVGLTQWAGAEADCTYALAVKPTLTSTLFTLATVEEQQGKREVAAFHYRQYAATPDADPQFKAQATSRAAQLSGAAPSAPPAPPMAAVAAQPSSTAAKLVVYRNHYFNGSNDSRLVLTIDERVVGNLEHDQYVEVTLPPGEHMLEACVHGLRYSRPNGRVLEIQTDNGQFVGARIGDGERSRIPCDLMLPVQLVAGQTTYTNIDTRNGKPSLVLTPAGKATAEIARDCSLAYSRQF